MTTIKISPITNLSFARFAAAAGIQYMGFCFDPNSENFLLPMKAKEILDWTSGSYAVGEFGNQSLEEIKELSDLLNMEVVLLDNSLLPDELPQIGKPIIKAIQLDNMGAVELANELCAYAPYADAFQLNGLKGIEDREGELKEACLQYKIIWNLPFQNSTLLDILNTYKPYGINILAAKEEEKGMNDFEPLNELLQLIQS